MNTGIENLSSRKLISECRDLAVACYNKSFDVNSSPSGSKIKQELQSDLKNLMNKLRQLENQ